jgi:phosphoribosylformylglycinamidine (FGAM) synthase-like amidotransferase family enzyme
MDMFKEPVQNIIHEIRTIFQHERCSNVSAIMMVGGFSEADVLQKILLRVALNAISLTLILKSLEINNQIENQSHGFFVMLLHIFSGM